MTFEEFGKNEVIIRYDDPTNIVTLFEASVMKYPNNFLFGEKDENLVYHWNTYKEIGQRVDNLRAGLASLNIIHPKDNIGIIANNRSEWAIAAFASYGLNCRWVPMYEDELEDTWHYIIKDADIKVLFVANPKIEAKIQNVQEKFPNLQKIIVIDSTHENSMQFIEKLGEKKPIPSIIPDVNDIANLIYTSGTTGDPKGVLLTHGNFTSNSQAGRNVFPHLGEHSRTLNILPWAHSYAFTAELLTFINLGSSIGLTTIETMSDDFLKIQPTILISVPRLFNKIYAGIHKKMEEEGGIKLKMFNAAKEAAKVKRETGKSSFKLKILDKLVFGKIRKKLGNKIGDALTASAKTDVEIANFFNDVGIPIYDAYGMTETAPALTMNCPSANKLGTVGKPVEKVKIVIDKTITGEDSKDGEIIAFGPNVMVGYHNKPEKTEEVMVTDEHGHKGVRTGDRGWLDEDGFLHITGRIKTEYKLSNGKYIHPAAIEEYIKLLPWVANAMIYGEAHAYNVGLIVPDLEVIQNYANTMDLTIKDPKKLIKTPELQALIEKEIKAHLRKKFGGYEIPRKFSFILEDFSVENQMLTQTLKLKRRFVLEKYQTLIDSLYQKEEKEIL